MKILLDAKSCQTSLEYELCRGLHVVLPNNVNVILHATGRGILTKARNHSDLYDACKLIAMCLEK